ncbi:hypothetical protein VNO78_17922 [Psophocarpus tetragonolobus]|uniref:Uncharacterized protein n=1 Tax=Psophocarpus tetragonolobus TaxID=3891 RepID=A0AAN9XLI8_PSOTE
MEIRQELDQDAFYCVLFKPPALLVFKTKAINWAKTHAHARSRAVEDPYSLSIIVSEFSKLTHGPATLSSVPVYGVTVLSLHLSKGKLKAIKPRTQKEKKENIYFPPKNNPTLSFD